MEVISINVAGKSLELGAQPSYGAFNDLCQGEDRTGLRLWALPARRVVQFLESAPSLVRGKNVIELGCGAHAALAREGCRWLRTQQGEGWFALGRPGDEEAALGATAAACLALRPPHPPPAPRPPEAAPALRWAEHVRTLLRELEFRD